MTETQLPERLVPFAITVCGIEELTSHCGRGVTHVLTLLDPESPTPEALETLGARERLDMRFHDVVDPGGGFAPPELAHVKRLLAFGRGLDDAVDAHLLVHCQMGISRSSAAMFLLLAQARPNHPAAAVLGEVVRIRPHAWPNLRMVEFGDLLLERDGTLVAAAVARYRYLMTQRPKLRDVMGRLGRGREIAAADALSPGDGA